MSRQIDTIIVHASATPPSMDIGVEEIRKWHVEERGWSDVGYHVVIRRDGTAEMGRPFWRAGAHCRGHNSNSIGVCLIGGTDANDRKRATANFTLAQYKALAEWVEYLDVEFGPGLAVIGHRSFNSHKACPCFEVDSLLSNLGERDEG